MSTSSKPESKDDPENWGTLLLDAESGGRHSFDELASRGLDRKDAQGRTPLSLAVELRLKHVVELLIKRDVEINSKDNTGRTPLFVAVLSNHAVLVELLARNGADVNSIGDDGQTALLLAAQKANEAVAEVLIGHGADVNYKNKIGRTPLLLATERNSPKLVQCLLSHDVDANCRDNDGQTPLLIATLQRRLDIVTLLITKGAELNCKNKKGQTPLLIATEKGITDIIELLVESGADVNCHDEAPRTPLSWVTSNGYTMLASLLLHYGADPNARNLGQRKSVEWTALHFAVLEGKLWIAQKLIAAGADIEARCMDDYGQTALHEAAKAGDREVLRLLLNHGADTNAKTIYSLEPPVLWAMRHKHAEVVPMLLDPKFGYQTETKTRDNETILHWTAKDLSLFSLVVDTPALMHINLRDTHNATPLLYSIFHLSYEAMRVLVQKGADLNCGTLYGKSALDLILEVARPYDENKYPGTKGLQFVLSFDAFSLLVEKNARPALRWDLTSDTVTQWSPYPHYPQLLSLLKNVLPCQPHPYTISEEAIRTDAIQASSDKEPYLKVVLPKRLIGLVKRIDFRTSTREVVTDDSDRRTRAPIFSANTWLEIKMMPPAEDTVKRYMKDNTRLDKKRIVLQHDGVSGDRFRNITVIWDEFVPEVMEWMSMLQGGDVVQLFARSSTPNREIAFTMANIKVFC